MATISEIIASVAQFLTASDKAFAIVNGPASGPGSEVTVASGVVPTMAKVAADNVVLLTPLSLTAPPVNAGARLVTGGTYGPVVFVDFLQAADLNGKPRFLGSGGVDYGSVAWELDADNLGNPGYLIRYFSDAATTFNDTWLSLEDVASPELVTEWTPRGDSTGSPEFHLTEVQYTTPAAYLNQPALVTTTNASNTYVDKWSAVNVGPVTWQPPANIFPDTATGILYRQIVTRGTPILELAYP